MIAQESFLQSLAPLREKLTQPSDELAAVVQRAQSVNPWFTEEFIQLALSSIANEFLDAAKCEQWLSAYGSAAASKRVAVIMAGNLPLVGFHDLFSILISGHDVVVKLSDKDPYLLPWIMDQWIALYPELKGRITYTDRLDSFDAVIATGSNNSSRYFDYYFRAYPHILRKNRHGVAVLKGTESVDELKKLADDIFMYYGLGCRNVAKIYVPQGYDFSDWHEAMADWKYLEDHHKYKNNLEYNFALYIINSIAHINLGQIILKEDDAIASRIGCVHYSYYDDRSALQQILAECKEEIQCVVSQEPVDGWEFIRFGESQRPLLHQYADGVDTIQFLSALK